MPSLNVNQGRARQSLPVSQLQTFPSTFMYTFFLRGDGHAALLHSSFVRECRHAALSMIVSGCPLK